MMDTLERVELTKVREMSRDIVDYLRGRTGNNFQNDMYEILNIYYHHNNKNFEMPQAMRGDYKNDGWVMEDKLFYMMYSPIITKQSFYQEIQNKLFNDLTGLLKNICSKKMWGGEIKKAVLLVNTKDNRLPPNNTLEYEKIIEKCKIDYSIDFDCTVENLEYVEELLNSLPSNLLDRIKFKLKMARDVDYNEPNATDIINTIGKISKIAMENYTKNLSTDYKRISTFKKITINNLDEIRDEIELIISKLSVVEMAIEEMAQDISSIQQFEYAKNYIINTYLENKEKYNGVELFNLIVEQVSNLFPSTDNRINEIKYLVVYIFDKCDIFEKEEIIP